MVLSKLFPRTGIEILDAVREDRYYCFLIPLTIVPTMIAVYLNWVGMMFFGTTSCPSRAVLRATRDIHVFHQKRRFLRPPL